MIITSNGSSCTSDAATATTISNHVSHKKQHTFTTPFHLTAYAVSDTCTTATLVVLQAPVINIKATMQPLSISRPNGGIIKSTHTSNLKIPKFPMVVMEANIIPELEHASLILIKMLIDAGCQVSYNEDFCTAKLHDGRFGPVLMTPFPVCGSCNSISNCLDMNWQKMFITSWPSLTS